MMQTDVKSAHISAAGVLYGAPTRLRGLMVTGAAGVAATLQFLDSLDATGAVMMEFDVVANSNPNGISLDIPGQGVRFYIGIYLKLGLGTITGVTIFHG